MELNKLNWNLYALTFGPQTIPPISQKISKNRMSLTYNHYKRSLCKNGDMLLQRMMVVEQHPTVAGLMASQLAKYITIASNTCGYGGTTEELILNYVHLLFLKYKYAAS